MKLQIWDTQYSLEAPTSKPGTLWATLKLKFKDEESDLHPSVDVTVPVEATEGTAIANIQSQMRDRVREALRSAHELLEAKDIHQILSETDI